MPMTSATATKGKTMKSPETSTAPAAAPCGVWVVSQTCSPADVTRSGAAEWLCRAMAGIREMYENKRTRHDVARRLF